MSTLLKATARLTRIGAAVNALLARVGERVHSASLNLHDAAFSLKLKELAHKQAALTKALKDTKARHLSNVDVIMATYEKEVKAALDKHSKALGELNNGSDIAFSAIRVELVETLAAQTHYRAQLNDFRS